jgi:hypothetical protein
MSEASVHRASIVVASGMIAVAAAMLVDGRGLAPGPFEPVGSGTIPNGVAAIVIALASCVLWQAARASPASARAGHGERWPQTLGVFAWTTAYVLVLASGAVRYQWATLAFFIVAVLILAEQPLKSLRFAAPIAVGLAFGIDYVFRRILVADIP